MAANPKDTALFVSAFFDELMRLGVSDVVVSPGSRSTALAMTAYEAQQRFPENINLYVDIDERGAAFFALGMAKASGKPVCAICTSGTAVANYYPAVIEAETSRVPLILLTGDRPERLQKLGAPQTCDQLNMYGNHVNRFQQMPLPAGDSQSVAFSRQIAREAVFAAIGYGSAAGVAHINFQFDEPLKPDFSVADVFELGRSKVEQPSLCVNKQLSSQLGTQVKELMKTGNVFVLVGEGTYETASEAQELITWAAQNQLPLLADPLSGLRSFNEAVVIDNFDNVFRRKDIPLPDIVVRFGRYPVSKPCTQVLAKLRPIQIVVDPKETRDFNTATDIFIPCTPQDFVRSLASKEAQANGVQEAFCKAWIELNEAEAKRIASVESQQSGYEGAFVRKLMQFIPDNSCLFVANSMPIRAVDTFYTKQDKQIDVLCNRGQNGIDGTVSTALGAAQHFSQTTFLTGDYTLQHDLNALALQREILKHHGGEKAPSIVIVLMNNNGGAIFDMLPQKSEENYFERLFLAPQDVDFSLAATAFHVPYKRVTTVAEFEAAYTSFVTKPGISLVEITLPLQGVTNRYAVYQQEEKQ